MRDEPWVEVSRRPEPVAAVVVGALESEGLLARVEPDVLGRVIGLHQGSAAARVLVHPDDAARARELLAEIDRGAGPLPG